MSQVWMPSTTKHVFLSIIVTILWFSNNQTPIIKWEGHPVYSSGRDYFMEETSSLKIVGRAASPVSLWSQVGSFWWSPDMICRWSQGVWCLRCVGWTCRRALWCGCPTWATQCSSWAPGAPCHGVGRRQTSSSERIAPTYLNLTCLFID